MTILPGVVVGGASAWELDLETKTKHHQLCAVAATEPMRFIRGAIIANWKPKHQLVIRSQGTSITSNSGFWKIHGPGKQVREAKDYEASLAMVKAAKIPWLVSESFSQASVSRWKSTGWCLAWSFVPCEKAPDTTSHLAQCLLRQGLLISNHLNLLNPRLTLERGIAPPSDNHKIRLMVGIH